MFSIIIPMFNGEKTIDRCLQSILRQTCRDYEIIVIDDGSQDKGVDIVERLSEKDSRIRLIRSRHKGVVFSRRKGVRESRGEHVLFVDCDDTLGDGALMHFKDLVDKFDADVISAKAWIVDEKGRCMSSIQRSLGNGLYTGDKLEQLYSVMMFDESIGAEGVVGAVWSTLFKKGLLNQSIILGIPEQISYGEDAAIVYISLLNAKSVYLDDKHVYNYYRNNGSSSNSPRVSSFLEIGIFYDYMKGIFEQYNEFQLERQLKIYTCALLRMALNSNFPFEFLSEYSLPKADENIIKDKTVIIHGVGKVGKSIYRYISGRGLCQKIMLVDRNKEGCMFEGIHIHSESLYGEGCPYDYVIIANAEKDVRNVIREDLVERGVAEEKILVSNPQKSELRWDICV